MIDYQVIRSAKRKSIEIRVAEGIVRVRAPLFATDKQVHGIVVEKSQWIKKQLAKSNTAAPLVFENGTAVLIQGQLRQVEFFNAVTGSCHVQSDRVMIGTPANVKNRQQYGLKQFDQWLKKQAEAKLVPLVDRYALMLNTGHLITSQGFRLTKSKWGHCTSKGELQFNPRVIMAPETCWHYLVAHEVAHLVHMNHSVQFWQLVDSMVPHRAASRQWLKDHQQQTLRMSL